MFSRDRTMRSIHFSRLLLPVLATAWFAAPSICRADVIPYLHRQRFHQFYV
jgi:hypothetical protein